MRLATWNVNSLKARLPRVLEFLAQHTPDVVCLQETKMDAASFPHAELEEAGYGAVAHCGGRWAGVAIVVRHGRAVGDVRCGLPGEPASEEARWVEATVDGVRVASVYVPNGRAVGSDAFLGKLAFLDALADHVGGLVEAPLALGGDFNIAPTDEDVYDVNAFAGSTHVTPMERRRLVRLLDAGLVDAFRHLHPDKAGFTWWDYRAGHFHRGLGMRIDLLLLSAELGMRLRGCGIDRNYRKGPKPSDHAPLLADLARA